MFKNLLVAVVVFASVSAQAEDWCIWDGEEYIQTIMQNEGKHWLQAVYGLHTDSNSTDITADPAAQPGDTNYEGVGSCRFIDRAYAENAGDAINIFVEKGYSIIATRAYLKMAASNEIVLPKAFYAAGTNWLYVEKDFYSMDRPVCEAQKAQMIQLGKDSSGIRFTDVEYKRNANGGVSAIINANTPGTNYLGVCHFN